MGPMRVGSGVKIATFAFCCGLASSGAFRPLANWENAGDFGSVLGVSGLKRKRRESEGVKAAFSTSARTKVAYVWLLFWLWRVVAAFGLLPTGQTLGILGWYLELSNQELNISEF